MMPFYIVQTSDDFDVGIPMGFETGFVEDKADLPRYAKAVEDEKELEDLVKAAELADAKAVDVLIAAADKEVSNAELQELADLIRGFEGDLAELTKDKRVRVPQVQDLAQSLGIRTTGKRELDLVMEIKAKL